MKNLEREKEKAGKKHLRKIMSRLKRFENMSLLERYAIFMGKVQIIELLLKQTLANEKGYDFDDFEKKTLGQVITLMRKEKADDLLLFCLDDLLEFRNDLAHEFLANIQIMHSLLGKKVKGYTKPIRHLEKALFSAEQFLLNFETLPTTRRWSGT